MTTIHKQMLSITQNQTIEMPDGAKILSVQFQNRLLCVWYIFDATSRLRPQRKILILGTGHKILTDISLLKYISTVQEDNLVWHIFEDLS